MPESFPLAIKPGWSCWTGCVPHPSRFVPPSLASQDFWSRAWAGGVGLPSWSSRPQEKGVLIFLEIESRFRQLAEHIDHDIARRHSRLRSWTPYYYYHRAMKRLDSLPAWCEVGYDFDCLLQRV